MVPKKSFVVKKCLSGLLILMASVGSVNAQCTAPAAWFPHEKTARPDDNANFNSNCAFHQWSWQMFLWLTQPSGPNGMLRFETFATPGDLFAVNDAKLMAHDDLPARSELILTPRSAKPGGATNLDEINQAGSNGILVERDGDVVYYSQHLNQTFYDFIRENNFNLPENYVKASPAQNFPVGTLEIKASWRIVDPQAPDSDAYVRPARIQMLVNRDGAIHIDPTQTRKVTVALVGMHVVGVVKDHPEFIWATFQHNNNAPLLPPNAAPETKISDRNWSFYTAGTVMKDCNLLNAGQQKLDEKTQKVSPVTNAFLQYLCGGGSPENVENIQSLNGSVQSQLMSPVWKNYELVGATWLLPNTLKPGESQYGQAVGSVSLSNPTMETFTQVQGNCFLCHTTQPYNDGGVRIPALNMNLSHIMLDGIIQASQRKSRAAK